MSIARTTCHHRLPRAGIDPIRDAATAASMLTLAMSSPTRDETIVLLLDDTRRGIGIVVVSGTTAPGSVIEVVECVARPNLDGHRIGAIVVASIRATCDARLADTQEDIDIWLEMSDVTEQTGVELVEWFVVADQVTRPRESFGEPPRW